MLVFEERGKPEKNLSEQSREPTNSAHLRRRVRESNPGHIVEGECSDTVPTLLLNLVTIVRKRTEYYTHKAVGSHRLWSMLFYVTAVLQWSVLLINVFGTIIRQSPLKSFDN